MRQSKSDGRCRVRTVPGYEQLRVYGTENIKFCRRLDHSPASHRSSGFHDRGRRWEGCGTHLGHKCRVWEAVNARLIARLIAKPFLLDFYIVVVNYVWLLAIVRQ